MKRHSRIIVMILSVTLLLAAFAVTANAEEISGESIPDIPSTIESDVQPDPPSNASITPDPQPGYVEPSQQQSQESYVDPEPQYSYVDPEPQYSYVESYDEPDYNSSESNEDNVYYDADGNEYSDVADVYVGGDQTYTPPASTAPSAPLYDTSKTKIDEKTLSANDWNDIKAKLSGSKTSKSDGGDFAFIQNNTSTDDNGHLILIIGIALVALSMFGFGYLIVSKVNRRKKTAPVHAAGKSSGTPSNGNRYRSNSDYNDNFSSEKTTKKSSKPKNGKRYK